MRPCGRTEHHPVVQIRLRKEDVVYAHTFDSVENIWVTNQLVLSSRSTLYTFHTVISNLATYINGTSP